MIAKDGFGSIEIFRSTGKMFTPKLEILPPSQRTLWNELGQTPRDFVLYGGTALALRLGHRRSEDFDFFSNNTFTPERLRSTIPYLQGAEVSQFEANTLTAIVTRDGPVKVSLFGGLKLNRVQDPDLVRGNGIHVASLLDVAATKLATIQQRAQARDYEDLAAIIGAGVTLPEALAAAQATYGREFNGALSLKALTYFADGDLPNLPLATQDALRVLATQVDLTRIPPIEAKIGVRG
jgi:Nucleotidyl transferase AbiEii toxin, Type IV TA system